MVSIDVNGKLFIYASLNFQSMFVLQQMVSRQTDYRSGGPLFEFGEHL